MSSLAGFSETDTGWVERILVGIDSAVWYGTRNFLACLLVWVPAGISRDAACVSNSWLTILYNMMALSSWWRASSCYQPISSILDVTLILL